MENIPPAAKTIATKKAIHGQILIDNYDWLKMREANQTMRYLEEENKYASNATNHLKEFQKTLYKEIRDRIKEDEESCPYKLGDYWYYSKTKKDKEYKIYCRKQRLLTNDEKVILDLNLFQKNKDDFVGLGAFKVSDDGKFLAFTLDNTGFREYKFFLKNLITDEHLKEDLGNVSEVEWMNDNKTIFYIKEDKAKRPYQLYRHVIGEPAKNDVLIYEEKDSLFRLGLYRSKDKKYLFLEIESYTESEVRYLDSNDPQASFKTILRRQDNHEYSVEHNNGEFWFRTNHIAKNFRIMRASVLDPMKWVEVISHSPEVKIERMEMFETVLVLEERKKGQPQLKVLCLDTLETHIVNSLEDRDSLHEISLDINMEFCTNEIRYQYESFLSPMATCEYDLKTRKSKIIKQTEILGDYNRKHYRSERIYAKSKDGTEIPISIAYKKNTKKDGNAPLWLYGYGAYGISLQNKFSVARISLLDRGVIFAQAHIRGGGDLGEQWHEEGRMMKKKNTFYDFISCAKFLVNQKYTSHQRMVIQGGSAGGMLIGSVLNEDSNICKAAHLAAPFVDVLNTMLDDKLPLTVGEYVEWGNPNEKKDFDYIKSYCPYTNIQEKEYPNILVTAAFHDSQVMYWEPVKYMAKLRSLSKNHGTKLLRVTMDNAGHSGVSGRYLRIKEVCFEYSVMLDFLGITS